MMSSGRYKICMISSEMYEVNLIKRCINQHDPGLTYLTLLHLVHLNWVSFQLSTIKASQKQKIVKIQIKQHIIIVKLPLTLFITVSVGSLQNGHGINVVCCGVITRFVAVVCGCGIVYVYCGTWFCCGG